MAVKPYPQHRDKFRSGDRVYIKRNERYFIGTVIRKSTKYIYGEYYDVEWDGGPMYGHQPDWAMSSADLLVKQSLCS
jgi:hypothetical protein